jgi:hypothetical protein
MSGDRRGKIFKVTLSCKHLREPEHSSSPYSALPVPNATVHFRCQAQFQDPARGYVRSRRYVCSITILFTSLPIHVPVPIMKATCRRGEAKSGQQRIVPTPCLQHPAFDTSTPCQSLDTCGGTVSLSRELIISRRQNLVSRDRKAEHPKRVIATGCLQ